MSWAFRIPYRRWGERLDLLSIREVAAAISDPSERAISAHVLEIVANERGCSTFGAAAELINGASYADRRQLLDRARAEQGLEPSGEIDRRRFLAACRRDDLPPPPSLASAPPRDAEGKAWLICAAPSCEAAPANEWGELVPTKARRWFCGEHRHLAAEGDLADRQGPPLRIGVGGLEQELTPDDKDFYAQIDRDREDEDEERIRQREAEAEAVERAREKYEQSGGMDQGAEIAGVKPSQVQR